MSEKKSWKLGGGIIAGLALGIGIGVSIDNLPLGVGIGIILGTAVDVGMIKKNKNS